MKREIHPVKKYCWENQVTQRELAKRSGVAEKMISAIVKGNRGCGRKTAISLWKATNGEISIEELILYGYTDEAA